jgi:hypothetical protein
VTSDWTAEQDAAFRSAADGASWLRGAPMDPLAAPAERLSAVPGVPFAYRGSSVLIVGPTGGGRSSLAEACLYDAALAGVRCAYLGCEVGPEEFNARAADLAQRRGDQIDDDLRDQLAQVRYLDLPAVIVAAWADPVAWVEGMATAYEFVVIDPLSAVASALGVDFDSSNAEYVAAHDRLVQPLVARGLAVMPLDNIGHAIEAKNRAKGASAKSDRADVTLSCAPSANPHGLVIRAGKVRSVRAPFARGDEWLFLRDSQRIEPRTVDRSPEATFRPTAIMERVSKLIEDSPGVGVKAIRSGSQSKSQHVDLALRLLLAEHYAELRIEGQTHGHHSLRPYRQMDDEAQPCSGVPTVFQPCSEQGVSNRVPRVPLLRGHGTRNTLDDHPNGDQPCSNQLLENEPDTATTK